MMQILKCMIDVYINDESMSTMHSKEETISDFQVQEKV